MTDEFDIPEFDPTGSYAIGAAEAQAVVDAIENLPEWLYDEAKGAWFVKRLARIIEREVGRDVLVRETE